MNIRSIRIILIGWAIICLIAPAYSFINYPIMKLPTDVALRGIETNYIDVESLNEKDLDAYEFNKSWVLGNDEGLKKSAETRHTIVLVIGIGTSMFCILLALCLPHLTRRGL